MPPAQFRAQWLTATDDLDYYLDYYLDYTDGAEICYEVVDRGLTEMPPESNRNARIPCFLVTQWLQLVPFTRLCHKV